jgi:GxxExxY protein
MKLQHEQITEAVIGCAIKVHSALGPGLLEKVYEVCLAHELAKAGLSVQRQVPLPVRYDGLELDAGFCMDLIVEGCVVIELKAIEKVIPLHQAQLMTYLRLSGYHTGLLLNFNVLRLADGITRRVL